MMLNIGEEGGKYLPSVVGKVSPLPGFIMGIPYFGGEFCFKVEAYDREGNVITDSAGFEGKKHTVKTPDYETKEAYRLLKNNRFEKAKDILADSADIQDKILLARLYEATFEFEKAAECYRELFDLTGDYSYMLKYADLNIMNGNYQAALEALESLPQKMRSEKLNDIGKLYLWAGEFNRAEHILKR